MVAAARPATSSRTRQAPLVSTELASRRLRVPGRTLRRWAQREGLGVMVAGRRVLGPQDLRQLERMRDQATA